MSTKQAWINGKPMTKGKKSVLPHWQQEYIDLTNRMKSSSQNSGHHETFEHKIHHLSSPIRNIQVLTKDRKLYNTSCIDVYQITILPSDCYLGTQFNYLEGGRGRSGGSGSRRESSRDWSGGSRARGESRGGTTELALVLREAGGNGEGEAERWEAGGFTELTLLEATAGHGREA